MTRNGMFYSAAALALGLQSTQVLAVDISIGNVLLRTDTVVPQFNAASDHTVWADPAPAGGPLFNIGPQPLPYGPYLGQNATNPRHNIEISTFDGAEEGDWLDDMVPRTTLYGEFNGSNPIRFESLLVDDWSAGGNALAKDYVDEFLQTWLGISLNPAQLALAAAGFIDPSSVGASVPSPAFRASDPNLSYAYQDSDTGVVTFGTAGLLDATSFFQEFFDGLPGMWPQLPPGVQASEVVKVTYNGETSYQYGFSATDSRVYASDCPTPNDPATCSYSGNFEFRVGGVPEPATLALLGLGVAGIGFQRRKQSKA